MLHDRTRTHFVYQALLWSLILVGISCAVEASEVPWPSEKDVKGQPCRYLWDYPSDVEILAFFAVYVRPEGGSYNFDRPTKIVLAIPELVTGFDCTSLILAAPGHYFAVIRAVSISNEKSEASNEVSFLWGTVVAQNPPEPPPPTPPPTPQPPRSYIPPPPPRLPTPQPTPKPPTSDIPGKGWVSDTPEWKGLTGR